MKSSPSKPEVPELKESIAPGKKTRKRSLRRRIIFYLFPYLVLIILLLGIELGTRVFLPHVPSLDLYVRGQDRINIESYQQERTFEGDATLGWKLMPNLENRWWDYTTFSTNSLGIRPDREIGSKPHNGIRVLCLGDSVTFGYRVPESFPEAPLNFNRDHHPYPVLLEQMLADNNPDRPVEVLNLSTPGYTTHQGLAWLRRDIEKFKPDLITVNFGWNDTDHRPQSDRLSIPTDRWNITRRWLSAQSQAVIYASRWLESSLQKIGVAKNKSDQVLPWQPNVRRVSEAEYVENILAIADLAQKHDARVVVIGQVYRDSKTNPDQARLITQYRRSLATSMKEHNIPYLEIPELTEAANPENAGLFGELIHPNYIGHQLMADRLWQFLAEQGILADLELNANPS
ncbi:lipolytic protein G-D-S-L family [Thalassoporum mexicanum PCC 7367]|uniref:SGNH/GDSL hydrolase family protein n=1 Tax=Thalassoporum mexicanum TaxID=3457544 RepID=UPI00029F88D8|nr:GDSL-type esterase/lipase family protein [Pseudanabaena sp. PCC 7367]AFY70413.1 lipolytic protein G-D-S-L family [Pseudanabaena sp. PCC 7367]